MTIKMTLLVTTTSEWENGVGDVMAKARAENGGPGGDCNNDVNTNTNTNIDINMLININVNNNNGNGHNKDGR